MIPGSGRSPGIGSGNPLQYSSLENSMDRECLAGYILWGCKESDTAKRRAISHFQDMENALDSVWLIVTLTLVLIVIAIY